jgi:hypothetical protein
VPVTRYSEVFSAPKLTQKVASRSPGNRSVAAAVSSALPLRPVVMAKTSTGSARKRWRAALMQYTPMS